MLGGGETSFVAARETSKHGEFGKAGESVEEQRRTRRKLDKDQIRMELTDFN